MATSRKASWFRSRATDDKPAPQGKPVKLSQTVTISRRAYEKLLSFAVERLSLGAKVRDSNYDVFKYIDQEFYSFLRRNQEDQKRIRQAIQGDAVKPVDEKLSMIFAQIDEAVTYLLSVLAPDGAMYTAIAPKEKQDVAKGFATLMNKHAQFFKHYDEYCMFLIDALRYNFGAFGVFWETHRGNMVINNRGTGQAEVKRDVVIQAGNCVECFDPYNLLVDASVCPTKLSHEGEFFGVVELMTRFKLMRLKQFNELTNCDEFLQTNTSTVWYKEHAQVRTELANASGGFTDWFNLLARRDENGQALMNGYEVTRMYCWLVPKDYELSDVETPEIWRLLVGGDSHILQADPVDNAHGLLPINIAVPFKDHFAYQTKSVAERLIPHQRFASFMFNLHQQAERKRLVGMTLYDPQMFPMLRNESADLVGGKFAAEGMLNSDFDIRKHFLQVTDGPDTTNTLQNVELMDSIMQKVLPTNILQQVAGLERATQYQAAATVMGANRRNLKIAKLINSQAMTGARLMMMYNVMQYQQTMEIIGPDGQLVKVNPTDFRDSYIEFDIDDGLKGIDKLSVVLNMKELFSYVVQSQQAAAQTDVMSLLDYVSTLCGDNTDFKQFKIQSPIDTMPAELRNLAFQLLQQYQQQQQQQQGGQAAPPDGAGQVPPQV